MKSLPDIVRDNDAAAKQHPETRKPEDGGPAFPVTQPEWAYDKWGPISGMSLRDYFAAQAMMGQAAYDGLEGQDWDHLAACAYEVADRLIAARASGKRYG